MTCLISIFPTNLGMVVPRTCITPLGISILSDSLSNKALIALRVVRKPPRSRPENKKLQNPLSLCSWYWFVFPPTVRLDLFIAFSKASKLQSFPRRSLNQALGYFFQLSLSNFISFSLLKLKICGESGCVDIPACRRPNNLLVYSSPRCFSLLLRSSEWVVSAALANYSRRHHRVLLLM